MKKLTRPAVVSSAVVALALLIGHAALAAPTAKKNPAPTAKKAKGARAAATAQHVIELAPAGAAIQVQVGPGKSAKGAKDVRVKVHRVESSTPQMVNKGCENPRRGPARKDVKKNAKKGKVQRFGQVIELKPEKKDLYIQLHENTWKDVLAQIHESNIRNYSIYMAELGGKLYLFAYFEYVGDDFEADMKKMAEDEATKLWWTLTDPCQKRLPGTPKGDQWKVIPEVFHAE